MRQLKKILSARHISNIARRVIKQNITISLGSVIIMAIASLFGIVPLTLGGERGCGGERGWGTNRDKSMGFQPQLLGQSAGGGLMDETQPFLRGLRAGLAMEGS